MQSGVETIPNAFRLFEMIFLILSVVAILLQSMVNYYSDSGEQVSTLKKGGAFVAVLFGVVAFAFAGNELIGLFSRESVNQTIITAAKAVLFGLVAVIVGIIIMVTDVLRDSGETPRPGSDSASRSNEHESESPQIQRRIVEEYGTSNDQQETTEEPATIDEESEINHETES